MLVPISAYRPVGKSARAIETLFEVDPEFVDICKTLYGDAVDPVDVWEHVFGKANPVGSDLATSDQRKKRAAAVFGIGTTTAGAALGAREIGQGARNLRRGEGMLAPAKTGGRLARAASTTAGRAARGPAGKLAWGGAVLAGDAEAVDALRRQAKKQPVDKAMPGVKAMGDGIETQMRRLVGHAGGARDAASSVKAGFTGKVEGKPTRLHQAGGLARTGSNAVAGTPKRRAGLAIAGAGAVGAGAAHHMSNDGAAGPPAGGGLYPMPYPPRPYDQFGKSDSPTVTWSGEFTKFDTDKRLCFGWASVSEINGMPVLDRQGDVITPDDLETAAYDYVFKSRKGGYMHRRVAKHDTWRPQGPGTIGLHGTDMPHQVSTLVESVVFTPEKIEKMGMDPAVVPSGWWVGFKVEDDEVWSKVKKGECTGFSIHGKGKRTPTSMDELVPGYA